MLQHITTIACYCYDVIIILSKEYYIYVGAPTSEVLDL